MTWQDADPKAHGKLRCIRTSVVDLDAYRPIVREPFDAATVARLQELYVEVLDRELPPAIRALLDRARR